MGENNLISRRDLLKKGFKTTAALGLGMIALNTMSNSASGISNAMGDFESSLFEFAPQEVCTLTCSQTLGPCYYAANLIRQDITEGKVGLPTRLGFRVVNADTCQPIQNALIDIWHTDTNGNYSGPINTMCSNDAIARTQTFLRGVQMTDGDGWAYFDSIYPGWYPGRTTHIHATIRLNNTNIVTTQFYFWDKVSESVYRNHPNYAHRPNRNTTNRTDNILGGSLARMTPYIFNTRYIPNKSLLALKTIAIRTSATTCNA